MKVLVVEDDQFFAQHISEALLDRDVQVELVQSVEAAVAKDLSDIDGAIIDIMLPNDFSKSGVSSEECRGGFLSGIAVARRLRNKKFDLPITLMSSDIGMAEAARWATENSVPLVSKSDGYRSLLFTLRKLGLIAGETTPTSFIVHGHDTAALFELKNYIQNSLKWREPIILREQQSLGKTLIEKFEEYARRIDCVFVLLTPDDQVASIKPTEEKRRSRQNVIFELGFFYGTLERKSGKILVLHKGAVELPSDVSGIVWIDISNGIAAAGEEIRKEVIHLCLPAAV